MARFRKVDVRIWADREFRRLSRPQPNGQSLWFYLLTGRETAIIPGAFAARESSIAEELGWSLEEFRRVWKEISGEAYREALRKAFPEGMPKGFPEAFAEGSVQGARKALARADWEAGFVWIPKAIKYNPPQSPNVIRSWSDAWDELPECDLKIEAYQGLKDFVEGMGEGFAKAFREAIPKPSWKPSRKPSPNQEQEQEQDIDTPPFPLREGERAQQRANGSRRPRSLRAQSADAWDQVLANVRSSEYRYGHTCGGTIDEAVRRIGGYQHIGQASQSHLRELRSRFREYYELLLERADEQPGSEEASS